MRGKEESTNAPIGGTDDDPLYQNARRGGTEYRFDNVPAGVYQVELRFAEIESYKPGQRIFDVLVEGGSVLSGYDIAAVVGKLAADDHEFFVTVTDGPLNIRFAPRRSYKDPIINALRVTHRPDR